MRSISCESLITNFLFVISGCGWSSCIPEMNSPHEASRYNPLKPRFPRAEALIYCFQFWDGRICAVEEMLNRQPRLTNLRDPPSLVGQRVRCVLVFHSNPRKASTEVRGLTYTDPSLRLSCPLNKVMSVALAKGVFDLAKAEFENVDPDKIRAGEVRIL